ncbi:hypothetical protein [Streptomyces clavuligerus]|uniref:hypothetical protein n=1 Tax=Streptomyces clavuligerus TaxID=1901 RepID=UPI00020D932B|nr:hypothetical protein [Streptomyces clavuligerus]WDN55989.1 hypothetical protein LL058_29325 [Streptomyces clavuligerus]
MNRIPLLASTGAAVLVLAGAGWGGYTWWQGDAGPDSTHVLCAPDLSRPESVAAQSEHLALVTVTRATGYLEEETDIPGGVRTVRARVDTALKGTSPAELELGQSVGRTRDGAYTTAGAETRYDLLQPGGQYVIGFYTGGSYGDAFVLYSETAPDPATAVRQWRGHLTANPPATTTDGC